MNKHTPVLLEPIRNEFLQCNIQKIHILDCTLGQAGHSQVLFDELKEGLLVSIDLDAETIEWVANELGVAFEFGETVYEGEVIQFYEYKTPSKTWIVLQYDFAKATQLLHIFSLKSFDIILADLGFSNYQLTLNKGISFDRPFQKLDMRYDVEDASSRSAAEILNLCSLSELENIFDQYGQIRESKKLAHDIVESRHYKQFYKVQDILNILDRKKYPKSIKYKFFQALRSFVNQEQRRLHEFLQSIDHMLIEGKLMIITFNSLEEELVQKMLQEVKIVEPDITELIHNRQARSAKLYIYNKNKHTNQVSG